MITHFLCCSSSSETLGTEFYFYSFRIISWLFVIKLRIIDFQNSDVNPRLLLADASKEIHELTKIDQFPQEIYFSENYSAEWWIFPMDIPWPNVVLWQDLDWLNVTCGWWRVWTEKIIKPFKKGKKIERKLYPRFFWRGRLFYIVNRISVILFRFYKLVQILSSRRIHKLRNFPKSEKRFKTFNTRWNKKNQWSNIADMYYRGLEPWRVNVNSPIYNCIWFNDSEQLGMNGKARLHLVVHQMFK